MHFIDFKDLSCRIYFVLFILEAVIILATQVQDTQDYLLLVVGGGGGVVALCIPPLLKVNPLCSVYAR